MLVLLTVTPEATDNEDGAQGQGSDGHCKARAIFVAGVPTRVKRIRQLAIFVQNVGNGIGAVCRLLDRFYGLTNRLLRGTRPLRQSGRCAAVAAGGPTATGSGSLSHQPSCPRGMTWINDGLDEI